MNTHPEQEEAGDDGFADTCPPDLEWPPLLTEPGELD